MLHECLSVVKYSTSHSICGEYLRGATVEGELMGAAVEHMFVGERQLGHGVAIQGSRLTTLQEIITNVRIQFHQGRGQTNSQFDSLSAMWMQPNIQFNCRYYISSTEATIHTVATTTISLEGANKYAV